MLEALARLHHGNALRAMGHHEEADRELLRAEATCKASSWLRAFWCFVVGVLKMQRGDYDTSLSVLRKACVGYESLDPHMAGLARMQEGDLHLSHHHYTEAIKAFRHCELLLDGRRAPLMMQSVLPINRAAAFNGLAEWDRAAEALAQCEYDQVQHRWILAAELVNKACLELGRGRPHEALSAFGEAKALCVASQRWLEVGLVEIYSVEAHVAVDDRFRAIENCTEALRIFRKAGCDSKTQEGLARLSQLLEPVTIDVTAVVTCVRQLARWHGGCLPMPAPDSRG